MLLEKVFPPPVCVCAAYKLEKDVTECAISSPHANDLILIGQLVALLVVEVVGVDDAFRVAEIPAWEMMKKKSANLDIERK